MKVGKKRKLLTKRAITTLLSYQELGVTLNIAIRNLKIDLSRPTVVKLLKLYQESAQSPTTLPSLFPAWLDEDGPFVQEQPNGWYYKGFFPTGEWYNENNQ